MEGRHLRIMVSDGNPSREKLYKMITEGIESDEAIYQHALKLKEARRNVRQRRKSQQEYEKQQELKPALEVKCRLVHDDELPTTVMKLKGKSVNMRLILVLVIV